MNKKVIIYSTPTCPYCKMAKDFFQENKIEYTDIDVADDSRAADEMVQKSGQMSVPVIIVEKGGKEEVVVGFNKNKLTRLLGL